MHFTSIHNHTECSNLRMSDGTIKVPALIDRAVELGYKGVCITDHEAISGHVRFLQHYHEGIEDGSIPEDFKIGLGNEIYLLTQDELDHELEPSEKRSYWHFILVAKDAEGHRQIRELSSRAWERWFREKGAERVPTLWTDLREVVATNPGHVIASTACLGGQFAFHMLSYFRDGRKSDKIDIDRFVRSCINIFGKDNFFLEMQPRMHDGSEGMHDQVILNRAIPIIADAYNIPYIVSTDSHYLKKEDRYVHEAYLQSDPTNKGERELGDFYETTYMMDEDDLRAHLSSHLEDEVVEKAIKNTRLVYNMLEPYDLAHPVIVPFDPHIPQHFELRHLFQKWYDKYPYLKKFAESEEIQDRYLLYKVEQGFIEKREYATDVTVGRINEEFETLWEVSERLDQRLSAYYVLVSGLIDFIWDDSLVGVARGSATGFYITYLLDITQISPLPYDLRAWRHLHPSRVELPDHITSFYYWSSQLAIVGVKAREPGLQRGVPQGANGGSLSHFDMVIPCQAA